MYRLRRGGKNSGGNQCPARQTAKTRDTTMLTCIFRLYNAHILSSTHATACERAPTNAAATFYDGEGTLLPTLRPAATVPPNVHDSQRRPRRRYWRDSLRSYLPQRVPYAKPFVLHFETLCFALFNNCETVGKPISGGFRHRSHCDMLRGRNIHVCSDAVFLLFAGGGIGFAPMLVLI